MFDGVVVGFTVVMIAGSCTPCTIGKASTGILADCDACAAGKYQESNSAPAYSCKSCGPGLYGDATQQTSEDVACKDCQTPSSVSTSSTYLQASTTA